MALAFTKTFAILGLAQMMIRIPLTYVVDPVPFASGGVFWGGVTAVLMLLILGPIFDLVSWIAWRIKVWRGRASGRDLNRV